MPGPVLRDTTPEWLKPEHASVFDSATTRAARAIAGWLGLTDPGQAVAAAAGPLMAAESKLEGPLGKVVERLGARARQLTGGFFSRVDEAAKQLPAKGAHPNKVAAILKNNASAEELEYRGVSEWLKQQGNTPITPEKLGAYLEAHPAPFPAVKTLGGPGSTKPLPEGYRIQPLAPGNRPGAQNNYTLVGPDGSGRAFYASDAADAEAMAADMLGLNVKSPTKYGQYKLPGGEAYRENLITLQRAKEPANLELQQAFTQANEELNAFRRVNPDAELEGLRNPDYRRLVMARNRAGEQLSASENAHVANLFRSGHFDEPNIVAHTRTTERALPTGEPGRFLEEVQSDWHQAGKARGYQPGGAEREALLRELGARLDAQHATSAAQTEASLALERSGLRPADPGWRALSDRYDAAIEANDAAIDAWKATKARLEGGGIPDAPFKETWPELGLKRELVEAAHDPRAEWLGFTTGQAQAERYDLSKQISKISYEPIDAGDYSLGTLYAYDKGGKQVLRETRLEPSALDEYIGKEPADALRREISGRASDAAQYGVTQADDGLWYVTDPNGEVLEQWGGVSSERRAQMALRDVVGEAGLEDPTISGLDLQVGGEGMREFYDRQLPRKLEKILKPLGGTVERGALRVPIGTEDALRYGQVEATPELGGAFFDALAQHGTIEGRVPVGDNAMLMSRPEMAAAFENGALTPFHFTPALQQRVLQAGRQEPIWMARLTPELKRRIREEGLPLLQLVGGAALGGITLEELHRRRPPAPAGDWFDQQGAGTLKDLHQPGAM